MTLTTNPPQTGPAPGGPPHHRRRLAAVVTAAVLAAGGLGAGLALSLGGSSTPTSYSYYQSMMGRYGLGAGSMMGGSGSMMGGSGSGWMMGQSGYSWMMGGTTAPGWMSGGTLPGFMMGTGTDPGKVMGALFADAPGPRVNPTEAATLGNQVPAGATVDRVANRVTFTTDTVHLAVLASPAGGPDETFRIAGLVNPTVIVPEGAKVTVEVINADSDTAHGLVVTASGSAPPSYMPMMTAAPAFTGSAVWFLGNPSSAGMHEALITFTASTTGTYRYLCPVPGHAQKGMVGTLIVS